MGSQTSKGGGDVTTVGLGYTIKHKKSGKCLDSNGSSVYYGKCDASNNYQMWSPMQSTNSTTSYNLKHNQSGKCLDGNGSKLYLSSCDQGNTYQSWTPFNK